MKTLGVLGITFGVVAFCIGNYVILKTVVDFCKECDVSGKKA